MTRLPSLFVIVLACFAASAQTNPPAAPAPHDAAGFLPAALADAAQAPVTNVPSALPPSTNNAATMPAAAASGYVNDDKHKLIPGDKLSFEITEDRNRSLPVSLQVTESAELDIPYIRRINVRGKTCAQVAADAKELLEKDYYYHATVIIGLDAMSKVLGKVYVWGPVRNQGPIEIPADETFTAGKAILRAGGFGDFADKKGVKVIRKTPNGNVTLPVNLVEVLEKGKTDKDVVLEPEDFIIVPQRGWNW